MTARAWHTCRDACRDRLPAMAGKTFREFPAHAQPANIRIWQEAHAGWDVPTDYSFRMFHLLLPCKRQIIQTKTMLVLSNQEITKGAVWITQLDKVPKYQCIPQRPCSDLIEWPVLRRSRFAVFSAISLWHVWMMVCKTEMIMVP